MEEGTKHKKTIFIGGISDDTDETTLYEAFSTFGTLNLPSHFGATISYELTLLSLQAM